MSGLRRLALGLLCLGQIAISLAIPEFVAHHPTNQVFGEPAGVTMREPDVPREDEAITIHARIGFAGYYTNVAIYYTTDSSTPSGAFGVGTGTTQVLTNFAGTMTFLRLENTAEGQVDWWRGVLPASTRIYGQTIRYVVSAWHFGGGPEIFANNEGCSDGVCNNPSNTPTQYSYTNKLAWPGRGAAYVDHAAGYPPVSFWKEEAVVGNNYINVMLDQNGTVYDIYYPSAGMVQGMGTKNEGYVGGPDTFPPGLPAGFRGQMNVNQLMGGIRVDGKTYWLSNESGVGYSSVSQSYVANSNVVQSTARLTAEGNNILVQQVDFSPKGITFPNDLGGSPNRGLYVKRYLLTNQGPISKTINFYYYGDFALNGGDGYDGMFWDGNRGAMGAYDNVPRLTSISGEYNPTSFADYSKNVSVYLAAALKVCTAVGGSTGTAATDSWRDTSGDNGQGWIGTKLTLAPGVTREVNVMVAGGFDTFPNATGTYAYQIAPALDWFLGTSMASIEGSTNQYWQNWLLSGTTVETPEARYNELFTRGLLATALHLDGKNGGVIAGMHNGAYPCVWPRDAVYAAITLDRTGHHAEAAEVYRFLHDIAYRAQDTWGKGFWYQKYTTDGYIVWNAPQVDETAVVPWGVLYHFLVTNDQNFLLNNWSMVYEAAMASSTTSSIDSRLYYDASKQLMHSNNVWEDDWGTFIYSNANVVRGLFDASQIAATLGFISDASDFQGRALNIRSGLINRLVWDGENSDISLLGVSYPFDILSPVDSRVAHVVNRIRGTAADRNGAFKPLVNTTGEFAGTVNRYWGDGYWNGGPWFLSTLWFGLYYANRADFTLGKADIDNHKSRIDVLFPFLGPMGLGAEQIAPSNSLLYPGEPDFRLQTAWPNAWESMSTYVDAVMAFLDYTPDAQSNKLRIAPKLPTGWSTMTFRNVKLDGKSFDITASETIRDASVTIKNLTGGATSLSVFIKIPTGAVPSGVVTVNGVKSIYIWDKDGGRIRVETNLSPGVNALTRVSVGIKRAISPP